MIIRKSKQISGWYGFFVEDENKHFEEIFSVMSLNRVKQVIDKLQEEYYRLKFTELK